MIPINYTLYYIQRSAFTASLPSPMSQINRVQACQSFYSIYSHESVFDQYSTRNNQNVVMEQHKFMQNGNLSPQPKMLKIAKSSINLDECALDIDQNSQSMDRKSYQTLRTMKTNRHEQKPKQVKIMESIAQDHQKILQAHNISEIQANDNNDPLQQSVCLLREIDCLSVEQVNPQQIAEIKKKIDSLRKEQITLQGSLSLANQMLRNAKRRNEVLEQEIMQYRKVQRQKQTNGSIVLGVNAKIVKQSTINKQHRYFPQQSQNNQAIRKLKLMYKECSLKQSFCIYQNQGYKIQVYYQREKHFSDPKILMLTIKLTPHHHILSRKQFKFGIQFQKSAQINANQLFYEGVTKVQEFSAWPDSKFHIQLMVHEFDEETKKHHRHSILVPLPISHFFQPRLLLTQENCVSKIKKMCSQYSISLTGSISMASYQKIKSVWWVSRFISCLGWNELVMFQIIPNADSTALNIQVYGKKNGKVIAAVIQFLSFYLTN